LGWADKNMTQRCFQLTRNKRWRLLRSFERWRGSRIFL
jgi:hypothetical protein